jgi:hypothetical protein
LFLKLIERFPFTFTVEFPDHAYNLESIDRTTITERIRLLADFESPESLPLSFTLHILIV